MWYPKAAGRDSYCDVREVLAGSRRWMAGSFALAGADCKGFLFNPATKKAETGRPGNGSSCTGGILLCGDGFVFMVCVSF